QWLHYTFQNTEIQTLTTVEKVITRGKLSLLCTVDHKYSPDFSAFLVMPSNVYIFTLPLTKVPESTSRHLFFHFSTDSYTFFRYVNIFHVLGTDSHTFQSAHF